MIARLGEGGRGSHHDGWMVYGSLLECMMELISQHHYTHHLRELYNHRVSEWEGVGE